MFNDPLHGITNNKGPTFYPFLQREGREHLMNNNKYGDPWYSLLNFRQICCAQHNGSKMTGHRLEDGTSVTYTSEASGCARTEGKGGLLCLEGSTFNNRR